MGLTQVPANCVSHKNKNSNVIKAKTFEADVLHGLFQSCEISYNNSGCSGLLRVVSSRSSPLRGDVEGKT